MLQNRVDPFGNLIKTSARGTLMGNRGLLHNDKKEIVRPFKLKAWITCKLEFKERKRKVMTPNLYTELFFLDEATAFAAGHRPCFECRREDYNRFKTFWLAGNPEYGFNEKTSIKEIDEIIHQERMANDFSKVTYKEKLQGLPDGAFIIFNDKAYLLKDSLMYLWTPFGYEKGIGLPSEKLLAVLTPKSVVNIFRAGYKPNMAI
jgi:hypothetical protein